MTNFACNSVHQLRSLVVLGVLPFAMPLMASLMISALAVAVVAVALLSDPPRGSRLQKKVTREDTTASLTSQDENEVLTALEQLAAKGGTIPSLVLYHPNPVIVRRALSVIDTDRDLHHLMPHLMQHQDPSVRQAAAAFVH